MAFYLDTTSLVTHNIYDLTTDLYLFIRQVDEPIYITGPTLFLDYDLRMTLDKIEYIENVRFLGKYNILLDLPDLKKVGTLECNRQLLNMGRINEIDNLVNLKAYMRSEDKLESPLKCEPIGNKNYLFKSRNYSHVVHVKLPILE